MAGRQDISLLFRTGRVTINFNASKTVATEKRPGTGTGVDGEFRSALRHSRARGLSEPERPRSGARPLTRDLFFDALKLIIAISNTATHGSVEVVISDEEPRFILTGCPVNREPERTSIMFFGQMDPTDGTGLSFFNGDVTKLDPVLTIPSDLVLAGMT